MTGTSARHVFVVSCLVLAVAVELPAQAIPDAPLSKGMLAFDGHGSLGAFTGTTTTLKGRLFGAATITAVHGWVEAPPSSLITGSGKRDRDMYHSLEVAKFPIMRFDLDSVETAGAAGDSMAVTLRGRFTIHGQTRETAVPGWVWLKEGLTRFRGVVPVDARDYGIGGLSKMLGILKMDPKIIVRVEVVFGT